MTPTRTPQLYSTVHADSTVTLALVEADLPAPGPDDVVVQMEAAPINPSDLGVMFAHADLRTLVRDTSVAPHAVRARLSPEAMQAAAGRMGLSIPAGNEGGGGVVAAGATVAEVVEAIARVMIESGVSSYKMGGLETIEAAEQSVTELT